MRDPFLLAFLALLAAALPHCGRHAADPRVVRIGHFPNVTHPQALVAHHRTRQGERWLETRLGPDVRVEWSVYTAGPSAMEALLAGSLDACYVGPSPALTAHARSGGAEVRVLAGAVRGGAGLVVRGAAGLATAADLLGRRVATPQLGNTQDVACRAWLAAHGFRVTPTGGDVLVVPTPNADLLPLFRQGALDAAWTVEPWLSRLVQDGGGEVLLVEDQALTTVLVAAAAFLTERPGQAARLVAAHAELTDWIAGNPAAAQAVLAAELAEETRAPAALPLLEAAFGRLVLDTRVERADFETFAAAARAAGLLSGVPDLGRLVEAFP